MPSPRLISSLFLVLAIALAGCRSSEETGVAISGRVELDGKPLPQGTIYFSPEFHARGRGAHSEISNGHYSIPAEEGPFPGKLVVQVTSTVQGTQPGPDGKPLVADLIPDKFNRDSKLMVDIPNRKSCSFNFTLSKQD
jgi:hypothetical protein